MRDRELVNATKEAVYTVKFDDGGLVDVKCIKMAQKIIGKRSRINFTVGYCLD